VPAGDVHFPQDLADALDILRKRPGILIYAGGTDILREQAARGLSLPEQLLYIRDLPELRRAGLTERFLEIGAAVTLSEILELGESALPALLSEALRGVGTPMLRNLATLGGNIASRTRFMDAWPALSCLDALVELRDQGGATWMNVNRLVGSDGKPDFPERALLTRIRVPIERWDLCVLRKVGLSDYPAPETAVFSFAARAEKGILTDIRIAFGGDRALKSQTLESSLIGRGLPLSFRETESIARDYKDLAQGLDEALALQFSSLLDGALGLLAR
jgi:CO/xanthine dehydrogenase FAD-binding subunit